METKIKINGMMCNHCKANVEKNLSQLDGVESTEVDLPSHSAIIKGDGYDLGQVEKKVNEIGYEYVGEA